MLEEILMGLGATIWIAGELLAWRTSGDTTTKYVRMKRVGRVGGTLFAIWLALHFGTGLV